MVSQRETVVSSWQEKTSWDTKVCIFIWNTATCTQLHLNKNTEKGTRVVLHKVNPLKTPQTCWLENTRTFPSGASGSSRSPPLTGKTPEGSPPDQGGKGRRSQQQRGVSCSQFDPSRTPERALLVLSPCSHHRLQVWSWRHRGPQMRKILNKLSSQRFTITLSHNCHHNELLYFRGSLMLTWWCLVIFLAPCEENCWRKGIN